MEIRLLPLPSSKKVKSDEKDGHKRGQWTLDRVVNSLSHNFETIDGQTAKVVAKRLGQQSIANIGRLQFDDKDTCTSVTCTRTSWQSRE